MLRHPARNSSGFARGKPQGAVLKTPRCSLFVFFARRTRLSRSPIHIQAVGGAACIQELGLRRVLTPTSPVAISLEWQRIKQLTGCHDVNGGEIPATPEERS
jgi:hypothetical protein